jgi:hypothetical protein
MKSPLYAMALSSLLAALCYVTMLPLIGLYNVFLTLFICFTSGVVLGPGWGIATGAVGMFLCSYFNPLGSSLPPILFAQMAGASFSGLLGGITRRFIIARKSKRLIYFVMAFMGLLTALIYHLLVDIVDAWLWGPFWVRLKIGIASSLVTIISNIIIFVVLFPVLRMLFRAVRVQIDDIR